MKVDIELTADDIRQMICDQVNQRTGMNFTPDELPIEVKSKQNYREHLWERGEFRIKISVNR